MRVIQHIILNKYIYIYIYLFIQWVRAMCDKSFSCQSYLLYDTTVIQGVFAMIKYATYVSMKSAEYKHEIVRLKFKNKYPVR